MYHIVEITFGHNRFDGEPLPENEVEAAQFSGLEILSELFEGGRSDNCIGACLSPSGLMFEPCSLLTAYAHELNNNRFEQLESLASVIAEFLRQQSVLLRTQQCEGELRWIRPPAGSTRQKDYLRRLETLVKLSRFLELPGSREVISAAMGATY